MFVGKNWKFAYLGNKTTSYKHKSLKGQISV